MFERIKEKFSNNKNKTSTIKALEVLKGQDFNNKTISESLNTPKLDLENVAKDILKENGKVKYASRISGNSIVDFIEEVLIEEQVYSYVYGAASNTAKAFIEIGRCEINNKQKECIPSKVQLDRDNIQNGCGHSNDIKNKLLEFYDKLPDKNTFCNSNFTKDNIILDEYEHVALKDWSKPCIGNGVLGAAEFGYDILANTHMYKFHGNKIVKLMEKFGNEFLRTYACESHCSISPEITAIVAIKKLNSKESMPKSTKDFYEEILSNSIEAIEKRK